MPTGVYARIHGLTQRSQLLLVFGIGLCFAGQLVPVRASEQAKKISSSQIVLDQWKVDQHLYVKGNVRVDQAALDALEQWLNKNGKNWTVVLMERASGEEWKDLRGVSYYGMDAVENALGRGLSNKQGFAAQKDLRTAQSNGAVLVIFLTERKFSYFGSDAQDHRGLGETAWSGNLDGPARDAMRNGGRILDAVKNTVTHIEGRLSQRIAYEQRLQHESKERQERLLRMTQREIIDLRREIEALDAELGRYRMIPAVQGGDIADPPLPEWQRQLDAAEDTLKAGHVETASSSVRGVRQKVKGHFKVIRNWYADRSKLKTLGGRVENIHLDDAPAKVKKLGADVLRLYQLSEEQYAAGNSGYSAAMDLTAGQLTRFDMRVAELERDQKRREQRALAQQRDMKRLMQGVGSAFLCGLCALGFWSNRKRRKSKAYAGEVLTHWQKEMEHRFDRLFEVMDRAGVVVGSEKDLPEREYEGETLKESLVVIRSVDQAFILSSGVDSVMDEVELLIHPRWPWSKAVNFFSRSRFELAVEMMERKPLSLGQGVMKVLDRQQDSLLGERVEDATPKTSLLFAELIQKFDATLNRADAALDRVDKAWETIAGRTSEVGLALSRIARREDELRMVSMSDSWLAAEVLFSHWHPAARRKHQAGIELGRHDPVAALDSLVPRAEGMVAEMEFVLAAVTEFRSVKMEGMQAGVDKLRRLGRRVTWQAEAMALLSSDLDALAEEGVNHAVLGECELFRDGLLALSDRVAHANDLAIELHDDLPRLMASTQRDIGDVRGRVSRELHLQREQILTERDEWDPDVLLDQCAGLKQTAEASLDHGAVEMAYDAIQSARDAMTQANQLVQETLTAYEEFHKRFTNSETLASEAEVMRAEGTVILQAMRDLYSEAVLQDDPYGGKTLDQKDEVSAVGESEDLRDSEVLASAGSVMMSAVSSMTDCLSTAHVDFKGGKILQARNSLIDLEESHQQVETLHGGLRQREEDLKDLEQKNTLQLTDTQSILTGLRDAMADPRVCSGTQGVFEQLDVFVLDVKRSVQGSYGEANPYQAERALDELNARLKGGETRIAADRDAFAAAEKMLTSALRSAKDAARIVEVSRVDGIPDSLETQNEVTQIAACTAALQTCQSTLVEPHSSWRELMKEIDQYQTRLGEANAGLKKELRRARLASDSIRMARKVVNQAVTWSGSYGVRITGAPGASPLQEAHAYLSQGRYDDAARTAGFARNQARQAIASAEAKEAQIRRRREAAERRRRAEAARLRRSRSRSSFSSSSSFGSSGSSSSFGSSSSSSSSNFSSGSGFSRSGW